MSLLSSTRYLKSSTFVVVDVVVVDVVVVVVVVVVVEVVVKAVVDAFSELNLHN